MIGGTSVGSSLYDGSMRDLTLRRAVTVSVATALMLIGMTIPGFAETDGTPGSDPALYAPPFSLAFPLEGSHGFSDTFGAIRDGGSRLHQGNDISAPKTTPVLAAAAGVVSRVDVGNLAGLYVEIQHAGGWRTLYLHLNDEEPPPPPVAEPVCEVVPIEEVTTDGAAAEDTAAEDAATTDASAEEPPTEVIVCEEAPVVEPPPTTGMPPSVFVGAKVAAGDVIGFVGTSGNASYTAPHLHFEVRMPDGRSVNPYPLLTGKTSPTTLYVLPDITDEPTATSIDVVGHLDPTGGFNADVWVHSGVAYLSTFGLGEICPATGVRRYDVTDPTAPAELGSISVNYPGTSTEAVWAGHVESDRFSGDLAIVAHQPCDPEDVEAFRGLALYDVTIPSLPVQLSTYEAGEGTLGIHSFDVWVEEGRALVVAAAPNSLFDHPEALGDVRLIDVTDPADPVDLADWDFRRDADETIKNAVLADADPRDFRVRGITLDTAGERAFVANWDAGVVILDLSDPSHPEAVGRTASLGYREGNAASTAFDPGSGVLVVNHRDLDPLDDEAGMESWGISVVFDAAGQEDPTQPSVHSIEGALQDAEGRLALDGIYSAQDAVVSGGYLYSVWLSGGLRVVDLSDPTDAVEVASFIPPIRVDPQEHFKSPNGSIAMPLAWSVRVVDNLIYMSDANTGLWILRLAEPPVGTN
jgi:hypothetical protein